MAPESMASAKRTPRVSRISRSRTLAYARKQKSTTDAAEDGAEEPASEATPASADATPAPADATPAPSEATAAAPPEAPDGTAAPSTAPEAASAPVAPADAASSDEPAASSATPVAAAAPDATTAAVPVEPARARVTTDRMPVAAAIGAPPAMPAAASTPPAAGAAEDPTRMPGPREIPAGHPDDPAAPPGRVPPGDSRSLRRRGDHHEFALIYRVQTYVISRVGVVGTRGQWRVVEYPTPTMASHAYAKECSRFVSDGFSDYRE